jgi:hypothetical protein
MPCKRLPYNFSLHPVSLPLLGKATESAEQHRTGIKQKKASTMEAFFMSGKPW